MIKPEQIPDEVVQEAWDKYVDSKTGYYEDPSFYALKEAIAAAINAWPGVEYQLPNDWSNQRHVILPWPQEKNDD